MLRQEFELIAFVRRRGLLSERAVFLALCRGHGRLPSQPLAPHCAIQCAKARTGTSGSIAKGGRMHERGGRESLQEGAPASTPASAAAAPATTTDGAPVAANNEQQQQQRQQQQQQQQQQRQLAARSQQPAASSQQSVARSLQHPTSSIQRRAATATTEQSGDASLAQGARLQGADFTLWCTCMRGRSG